MCLPTQLIGPWDLAARGNFGCAGRGRGDSLRVFAGIARAVWMERCVAAWVLILAGATALVVVFVVVAVVALVWALSGRAKPGGTDPSF